MKKLGFLHSSRLLISALVLGGSLMGCANYAQDFQRAKVAYEKDKNYEHTLAILRILEADLDSLEPADRVRYYYYRGMTDYSLAAPDYKVRPDARHWLGLARAAEEQTPGSLTADQQKRLADALKNLNHDVYGGAEGEEAKDGEGGEAKGEEGGSEDGGSEDAGKADADKKDGADTPDDKAKLATERNLLTQRVILIKPTDSDYR